jgi:LysR family transcriptional regulator, regulator for bpeEF and oprC
MTLEQLRILVKVVQAGSFTRAAELLATQKSYVSRVVAQLEAELGTKLLERTTRTLSVTEMGREVFERAVGILGAVEDTTRLVHNTRGEPRGLLRLTCGVEFGMLAVARWVDEFLAAHPMVSADVEYTSRVLDLVHEGFDLSIRVGALPPSRLVARPLGQIDYGLFACPRYLERQGRPETPAQLKDHNLVMFSGGTHRRGWQLLAPQGDDRETLKIEGPARLRVNNSFVVRDALLRSLGIGQLPLLIAADSLAAGRLVPVLPDWKAPPVQVHAVYPSNRYLSPNVRAFIDLAVSRFPSDNEAARQAASKAWQACAPAKKPKSPKPRAAATTATSGRAARPAPITPGKKIHA